MAQLRPARLAPKYQGGASGDISPVGREITPEEAARVDSGDLEHAAGLLLASAKSAHAAREWGHAISAYEQCAVLAVRLVEVKASEAADTRKTSPRVHPVGERLDVKLACDVILRLAAAHPEIVDAPERHTPLAPSPNSQQEEKND